MSSNIVKKLDDGMKAELLSDETKENYASIIRHLTQHENELLNMRFAWFTTIQGLLFASLVLTLQEKDFPITCIICLVGIIVSTSAASVFDLWRASLKRLESWWNTNLKDYHGPPPAWGINASEHMTLFRFFRPWRILPAAFIVAWFGILSYRIDSHYNLRVFESLILYYKLWFF